jgi:Glycosyl transferase family 2
MLHSLCAAYQRDIERDDYEVIVVDNGSSPPVDRTLIERLPGKFRLLRIDDASPSPAKAVNAGLERARGDVIGVMVDGARLATPGLLHFARRGARLFERSVVATLGWHLGFDSSQRLAMDAGYDRRQEDALLASIDWPSDGYRLFEIAALDPSSVNGWLSLNGESNALFLARKVWEQLGGVEERFDEPGGGLLNLDTFRRAVELPESRVVVLLGEATFHQVHGGVATNADTKAFAGTFRRWSQQYEAIRGQRWAPPVSREPRVLLGQLPRAMAPHFLRAALQPVHYFLGGVEPPLRRTFDPGIWSLDPPPLPEDAVTAALVDLARTEFRAGRYAAAAAVARVARARAPDEASVLSLLAHASPWSPGSEPPEPERVAAHVALGRAYQLLGDDERAAGEFRSALALESHCPTAQAGLAALRLPGDDFRIWLDRLHERLRPDVYVEIGGATLALARPPTRAFAIDPDPALRGASATETHVFPDPSDAFFKARRFEALLAGEPVSLALIDGRQDFEQCLRDFAALEEWCGPRSVVLLRDTVPLDGPAQSRDVWKVVLALEHYRADLGLFTIATAPTGLTVVTGLDPASRVLREAHDEVVRRFTRLPFGEVASRLEKALRLVPNNWEAVAGQLSARGVL